MWLLDLKLGDQQFHTCVVGGGRMMTNVGMAAATLPYPDRFYAGAAYAGFSASSPGNVDSLKSSSLGLSDDTALLLYGLYKQVCCWLLLLQGAN